MKPSSQSLASLWETARLLSLGNGTHVRPSSRKQMEGEGAAWRLNPEQDVSLGLQECPVAARPVQTDGTE